MTEELCEMTAKKSFKRIGLGLLIMVLCYIVIAEAIGAAVLMLDIELKSWHKWVFSFAPVYVLAFPIGALIMRKAPAERIETTRLGAKRFIVLMLICFFLMYLGSIVGTLLSMVLSGGDSTNPLQDIMSDDSILKPIVIVVLAPLFEEWLFRRQIIDRAARYGEKTAVILSAVVFGLFHMNFYQLFYAFALGLIFGYVYVRTRRLRYSVIMHMIINFNGSTLAPLIISKAGDADAIREQVASGALDQEALASALPGMALIAIYGLLLIGLSIAGLVLFVTHIRKAVFRPAEEELPKGARFKTVYLNVPMILFVLFCVGVCAAMVFLI